MRSEIWEPGELTPDKAKARYDELAENIHIYYHLDGTIDKDIAEFEELHFLLGKDAAA